MENKEVDKKDWSAADHRVYELTGFIPADRSVRQCITCGKSGHYYTECNNGEFLKMADALVTGLQMMTSKP